MKKLNVVVIGITDRPQTINVVLELLNHSDHCLTGVILEKRFSNRFNSIKSVVKIFQKFSLKFLALRMKELILLRLNRTMKKQQSFRELLAAENVKYLEVEKINTELVEEKLKAINPDVTVLAGAPIIKKNIINCAGKCTINIHRSLLPKYAGLDAIFWALYNGEEEVGATVHVVNEGIDSGDIILQESKKVEQFDDIQTLTEWYNNRAPALIVKALDLLRDPDFELKKQESSNRSYHSWPTKEQRKELDQRLKARKMDMKYLKYQADGKENIDIGR